ncbi:DUF937 domain-containing protein [Deinococcus radiotolerans]|uniref:Bacterial Ig domain-containing protein n=1 Tax=Deinococcus radiotolerans TaxID=1309407 RepID=A0ABQ2FM81_9DEIO|nr:DUF937 domain-containing protein [Deinococcus radiotolerans]GGL02854.1 hypothetical protein GCM10010844_21820 [Deinococcus radiotolerans]
MNFAELLHSFFDESGAARLAQAADVDPAEVRRILDAGLPLQLNALTGQADTPAAAHLAEAVASLPHFETVGAVLNEPDGASNLRQAGELLGPALLGDGTGQLARQAAGLAGTSEDRAGRVLTLTLPLLLSLLGRAGLTAGNVSTLLRDLSGPLDPPATPPVVVPGLDAPSAETGGPGDALAAGATTAGLATLTGPALLDWLRAQLAGPVGERLGVAAGLGASGAGRATQAALPVLLAALVRRAGTDAGAQELLDRGAATRDLVDPDGAPVTRLLSDPAETARIEGQGRALLGSVFPNLDPVTGRLGSALGSSGASAGRLLALLGPFLLALLGARARAGGLGAADFRTLLGGLGGNLGGLLPAGLGGLRTLLDETPDVVPAVTPAAAAPVTPVVTPAAPPPVTPPVTPVRRGGFPWWIIPLLLLLGLGGCWLVNQNRAAPPAASSAQAASIVVTNPTSGADLPAEPFTMSGTGPASTALTIADQGQEVAQATVGADGNWTADLPAPTPGEHTYTVDGGGGRSELKVNVADASASTGANGDTSTSGDTNAASGSTDAGTAPTDSTGSAASGAATGNSASSSTGSAASGDAGSGAADPASPDASDASTAAAAGAFTISEPAADATLPAGTFTLRGNGTARQQVELFEDDTSLGKITVGPDGTWSFDVPSPAAGPHTYRVKAEDGTELASVGATVGEPAADASAASCTETYTLSMTNGQTVNEPFRFGGVGQGQGYSVTVKRGARTIGTKDIPLDATCGWSYQSRPGPGKITYEVRPLGDAAAAPLSTVNLTVAQ